MAQDISSRLAQHMLAGSVLTDTVCTKCRNVPLMRTQQGIHICVSCETDSPDAESSSISSASSQSRTSTPPTEISNLSSPTLTLPPESEESRRRREQSDLAAAEIGKCLLKGWTMLATECPNPHCYGVPLVRPRGQESQKCVICRAVYATQINRDGEEILVPESVQTAQVQPNTTPVAPPTQQGQVNTSSPSPDSSLNAPAENSAISAAERALETSLSALSSKLLFLTKDPAHIEPSLLGQTADAIGKTTQALSHVKSLQWSMSHAASSSN